MAPARPDRATGRRTTGVRPVVDSEVAVTGSIGSVLVTAGALGVAGVLAATLAGGVAQGTVGFGAAFATVPALALTVPELLPGAMLVAVLPLAALMAWLERRRLDTTIARRLIVGRLPGLALGTGVVVVVDVRWLTAIVAVILLAAVAASASGWQMTVTPRRELVAGIASGFTGAATALGGPPLAILYRHHDPGVLRPTLSVVWAVGIVLTLSGLGLTGSFTATQAAVGLALAVVLLLGLLVGRVVVRRVSVERIRTAILAWAAVGGSAALVRAVLG